MEETTAKAQTGELMAQRKHLRQTLKSAVNSFRAGEDTKGVDNFQNAMRELEHTVEDDKNLRQSEIDFNRLLPILRMLFFYMQNEDMIGITDCLESLLISFAEEPQKGCGK